MKPAVWFSRHHPTVAQIKEIEALGFSLVEVETGMSLGGMSLEGDAGVEACVAGIRELAHRHGAGAVFGVYPTPVMAIAFQKALESVERGDIVPNALLTLFAAWNVTRSIEGGKPTFCHKKWQEIGVL